MTEEVKDIEKMEREENKKEKGRIRRKAYYKANREKCLEKDRYYYRDNREKILARQKNRRDLTKPEKPEKPEKPKKVVLDAAEKEQKKKDKRKKYLEDNKDKISAQNKAYKAANKEKAKEQRKARLEIEGYKEKVAARAKELRIANIDARLAYEAAYRDANRDLVNKSCKDYRIANKDIINKKARYKYHSSTEHRAKCKSYAKAEHAKMKAKNTYHHRMKHDLKYRTLRNLRSGLRRFLLTKGTSGTKLIRESLGCTWDEFVLYIEARFYDNPISGESMSWGHPDFTIDHVVPCDWFDTLDPLQAAEAFSHLNLQPMWAEENASKGAHVTYRVESPHLRYDRDGAQVPYNITQPLNNIPQPLNNISQS